MLRSGPKPAVFEQYSVMSHRLEENFVQALYFLEGRNTEAAEKLASVLNMCTLQVSKLPDAVTSALQPISGKELLIQTHRLMS